MQLKHLRHNEIDFIKWDACIQNASNSLVYAESWYLNIVSPRWEALVTDDYEYVMPLPVKRKFGISFLIQPPLTQQLGIFSENEIPQEIIELFIQKIPYRSYHLNLNFGNNYSKAIKQPNFVLDLNESYETLYSKFSKNTKRNIKKAYNSVEIRANLSALDFLQFLFSVEKKYVLSKIKTTNLLNNALKNGKVRFYGAYNQEDKLISALCLLCSHKRLIYLLPVSNKEGKETSAMFGIVNSIIQDKSEKVYFLDFEGSKIETIARFYQGYGAKLNSYSEIKHWSINDLIDFF